MKTLCMDTSHRHLVLVLYEDEVVKASYQEYSWKKQSETIFVELIRLMDSVGWKPQDIDEVVITKGPGSYTGLRIAMSIAKVFCTRMNKPLYTVSTLQLYAGLEDCYVLLDARSKRAYFGDYSHGICHKESIELVETLKEMKDKPFIGDVTLLDKESEDYDFVRNFVLLRPYYTKVENIHTLVPEYLKEESDYSK